MSWVTTPLHAGPITGTTYNCTISSLSTSTCYQYRAYMTVGGVPYYGNCLQGTTCVIPITKPTMTTGSAVAVCETCMDICNNKVTNKGGTCIKEYGLLYTQSGIWGTAGNLTYNNYPATVCKITCCADIPTGTSYFTGSACSITGLADSTMTYYRAYSISTAGIGYGTVKCQVTDTPPPPPTLNMDIWIDWCGSPSIGNGFCGSFQLKCCNGGTVCSDCIYTVCDGTHYTCFAPVPAGCYYFDFNGIVAVCNNNAVVSDMYIADNTGAGWYKCTGCFDTSNLVCACVYTSF